MAPLTILRLRDSMPVNERDLYAIAEGAPLFRRGLYGLVKAGSVRRGARHVLGARPHSSARAAVAIQAPASAHTSASSTFIHSARPSLAQAQVAATA